MTGLSSFEEARARKVERDTQFAKLDPFEKFWSLWPARGEIKQGRMMAQIKFDALTTTGLVTRIYDKNSGIYHPVKLNPVSPDVLIEAARKYASKIAAIRLKGETAYVQDAAKWLNDAEWQT